MVYDTFHAISMPWLHMFVGVGRFRPTHDIISQKENPRAAIIPNFLSSTTFDFIQKGHAALRFPHSVFFLFPGKGGLMRLQFNKIGYEIYDKEQSRRVPAVRAKPGNPGYGFRYVLTSRNAKVHFCVAIN
jgi:hypothetical protein